MAVTIDAVFIEEFTGNLISLSQQRMSILRSSVMEVGASGEGYNWDRIGSVVASPKTTRETPTPVVDTPFSRRKSIPATVAVGDVVENAEVVQMLPDPKSAIASEFAYAMARAYDDAIIVAATGDSRDGAGAAVTFPVGQLIDAQAAQLTFDVITAVHEKFALNNVDPAVEKLFVISPEQARAMLKLTEVTSIDYNEVRPLVTGEVINFYGFTFVVSTRLGEGAAGATTQRCFAMTKDAIGLQVNNSMLAKVSEDPSISYAWRVYCEATFGAIRVEDEKVVAIDVLK